MPVAHCLKKYRPEKYFLRWAMFYADQRRVNGIWSRPSDSVLSKASCQSRVGLTHVGIEAKAIDSRKVELIALVEAANWVCVRWDFATGVPTLNGKVNSNLKVQGSVLGLTLITKHHKISATIDGKLTAIDNEDVFA